MKRILTILAVSICTQCATLPREQRVNEEIVETGLPATSAYDKALTWLAKNLGNANYAVQIRDRENAHIVSQGSIKCPEVVTNPLYVLGNEHHIGFSIDFKAKEGKARLRFEDISYYVIATTGMTAGQKSEMGPNSTEDLERINRLCISPIKADFLKSLKSTNDDF